MSRGYLSLKTISVIVLIGAFFSFMMGSITVALGTPPQFFEATNIEEVIDELRTNPKRVSALLTFSLFDNLFVASYMTLFIGLYILTRKIDENISKFGLALGLATGISDIVENALNIFLGIGVPHGFTPNTEYFTLMWLSTYLKDSMSVMSTYIFSMLFISKIIFGEGLDKWEYPILFFLLFYTIMGSIIFIAPNLIAVRNISLILVLIVSAIAFYKLSEKIQEGY